MRRDFRLYLYDMVKACELIQKSVENKSIEEFAGDHVLRSAVERQFEILGEALTQMKKVAPDEAAAVPGSRKFIKFRNFLIHGYFAVKPEVVWATILFDIPAVLKYLRGRLSGAPG